MIFIPLTITAAAFQVARNAFQRGMMGGAGPWGAALTRFMFALPFSLALLAAVWAASPAPTHFDAGFWLAAIVGAIAQVGATACLLVSMRRSGFALGTAFQQSSLPLTAIMGALILHEQPSAMGWFGVGLTTAGVAFLSWPKGAGGIEAMSAGKWGGAVAGLGAGACYGVALNAYRFANLEVAPHHPFLAALLTNATTQGMQTAVLSLALFLWKRDALHAVLRGWRQSLGAGFCGFAASALWVTALALAPAAQVRAVGVVEMPISAAVGRRLFKERLTWRQLAVGAATALGVVLAAFG